MSPAMEVPTGFEDRFSRIERVAETGSTNADLLERAKQGEVGDVVLITDHQNTGRGRQGRPWFDRPGASLLMSVLLRPTPASIERGDLGLIPLVAGLAAKDVMEGLGVENVGLKWPNDVLVAAGGAERKLAGILAEATMTSTGLAVVVGTGLNLDLGPIPDRPAEVVDVAVDVTELVVSAPSRDDVASLLLAALARRLDELEVDRSALLDAYREVCVSIGRIVHLDHPAGPVSGEVIAIADDGGLTLATSGGHETFTAGEVHHQSPKSRESGEPSGRTSE